MVDKNESVSNYRTAALATDTYEFDFIVYDDSEVRVYAEVVDGEDITYEEISQDDFTVTLYQNRQGKIVFNNISVVLEEGQNFYIRPVYNLEQSNDLVEGTSSFESIETSLDRITRIARFLNDKINTNVASVTKLGNIVITNVGEDVVTAVSASAILTVLGMSTFFKTLIDAENLGALQTLLDISAFMKTLINDTSASAALTTLGFTTYGKSLIAAETATAARTLLEAPSAAYYLGPLASDPEAPATGAMWYYTGA